MSDPELELACRGRRLLVLGGSGFLGSQLVARATALGADVRAPTRAEVDVTGVSSALESAIDGCHVVFNLAGQSGQVASMLDPQVDYRVNQAGALAVLAATRAVAPQARVVFASSRLVYGRARAALVGLDHPTEPTSFYGVHKLAAEGYHRLFHAHHGLEAISLRITNPYGPRRPGATSAYGIVNYFVELAMRGEALPVYGDGAQARDYVYVDDVVSALLRASASRLHGRQFWNVGGGVRIPFVEMARAVARAVKDAGLAEPRIEFRPWPEIARLVETGDFVGDIEPTFAELGWRPQVSLAEGLARTVASMIESHSTKARP